jgi:hypothetical protein
MGGKVVHGKLTFGIAFLLGGTFLAGVANAQSPCPTFSGTASSGCGAVVTISGTQAMVAPGPAGGPYDGSDDTLVGVVNNIPSCTPGGSSLTVTCGIAIYSLDLTSTSSICGFDGDGIDTYGAPSNGMDSTGYGGPNVYFTPTPPATSINPNACRVNFIKPIQPGGGTGYFSLENALTNATNPCTALLNNSVPKPAGGPPTLSTTFTPVGNDPNTGMPYTQMAAATTCGFVAFDWQQTVTNLPTPRPTIGVNELFADAKTPTVAPVTPFNDPAPDDYYANTLGTSTPSPPVIAVYWGPDRPATDPYGLAAKTTATVLTWRDTPADSCLDGGGTLNNSASANSLCGGAGATHRAAAGSTINFTTHLVGLQAPTRTKAEPLPLANVAALSPVDTGIGFSWTSNYNGTAGGTTVIRNIQPADPGSGNGGTTITGYSPISTYTGVGVSGVNGSTNVFAPTTLLAAVLPASRSVAVNGTATAFATIINSGTAAATSCSIAPAGGLPLTFHYRTTDPRTNQVTGTLDTPVDIAAGGSQSFVIGLTPTAAIAPTDATFDFSCTNTSPAPIVIGLSTLLLSGSITATPDVVALSATATNDGILHIPGSSGTGAFATATVNVGTGDAITASANTGSATLPVALTVCQTNPANGQCLAAPAATVATTIAANSTPTFSVFATASGTIPFDPANSRIFVVFSDSTNAVRGETSVAVQTQ